MASTVPFFAALLVSLLGLGLSFPISPSAHPPLTSAVEILSGSGFVSMALVLQLTTQTLTLDSPFLTIFSPSDQFFRSAALPPLSSLQFHFSPAHLSPAYLQSLVPGSLLPSLLPNHSLVVTSSVSAGLMALNGVRINASAIYDDGSLTIYRSEGFFDPFFKMHPPDPNLDCSSLSGPAALDSPGDSFAEASGVLKSRGFSVAASLLDAQLLRPVLNRTKLTVFAPTDAAMMNRSPLANLSEYVALLSQHVIPCRLTWSDLLQLEEGTLLQTYSEGFLLRVTQPDSNFAVNGIPVDSPDMYYGRSVVVHGVGQLIPSPQLEPSQTNATTFGDYEE